MDNSLLYNIYDPTPPPIDPTLLARITDKLALWLPGNQDAAVVADWDIDSWYAAAWVAYWQSALPWFVDRLQTEKDNVPPQILQTLNNIALGSRERTRLMLNAASELLSGLSNEGIPALPLKGAVLAPLYYTDPLRRPLGDIDLLVRVSDLSAGRSVLEHLGYKYYSQSAEDIVYLRGKRNKNVWAADNVHPVEMHFTVREEYAGLAYNLETTLWENASQQSYWGGCEAWLPDKVAILQHVAAHATSDWLIKRGRLMHLDDICTLASKMSDKDWGLFLERINKVNARFIYPIFAFVKKYATPQIPDYVLETLRDQSPMSLISWCEHTGLADISMSNPTSRSGWGFQMIKLLAENKSERAKMWFRSFFPLRWNLTKRYPRLAGSFFWPLCYLLLNLDRLKHMANKTLARNE